MASVKVPGQKPGAHAFDGVKGAAMAHHKQGASLRAPRATMTTSGGGLIPGLPGSSITPEELTRIQLLQDAGQFAFANGMQMQAPVSEVVDIMEKSHMDAMALQEMQYHISQLNGDPMWNKWYIDNHPDTFERIKETIKGIGDLLVKIRIADLMGVPSKETLELNRLIAEGYITPELFHSLGVMPLDQQTLTSMRRQTEAQQNYRPGMFAPRSFYQGPPHARYLAGPAYLSGVYGGLPMLGGVAAGYQPAAYTQGRFNQTAQAPRNVYGDLFGGGQQGADARAILRATPGSAVADNRPAFAHINHAGFGYLTRNPGDVRNA